jgi:hypothetical protein
MTVDRADILAVLEERPYTAEELAELLEHPVADVLLALADLALPRCEKCRAAFLLKPGCAGRFCSRACYQSAPASPRPAGANRGGRRPTVDRAACQVAILAAIANGPEPTSAIVAASGFTRTAVKDELDSLLQAGQIQHLGASRWSTWALSTWSAPATSDDDASEDLDEPLLEADDAEPDVDADLTIEDSPAPIERRQHERPVYRENTRQAASKKPKGTDEPGWWVKYAAPDARDQFIDAAAARNVEMIKTSPAWKTQTKPNSLI